MAKTNPLLANFFILTMLCHCAGPKAANPCVPVKLKHATAVTPLRLPMGCRFVAKGSPTGPEVVASQARVGEVLKCSGSPAPKIDLTRHDLLLVRYTMSPAFAGLAIFDSGTQITFLWRNRMSCRPAVRAMRMSRTLGFLLLKGAKRTYNQASCTEPVSCD